MECCNTVEALSH